MSNQVSNQFLQQTEAPVHKIAEIFRASALRRGCSKIIIFFTARTRRRSNTVINAAERLVADAETGG